MSRSYQKGISTAGVIIVVLAVLVGGLLIFSILNKDNDIPDSVEVETPQTQQEAPESAAPPEAAPDDGVNVPQDVTPDAVAPEQ